MLLRKQKLPHNALGVTDELITEHLQYKRLGKESRLRCKTYKGLFDKLKSSEQDKLITDATMRGVVYGVEKFHRKIGKLIARPTKLSTHGGDRKSGVFLITPKDADQLAVFMQSMTNRYVRYFNAKHNRTGTIWEGRFKSCLVDSESYLFVLYKYIEMNPVKAEMVNKIEDYAWSSYPHNALGVTDELITEHLQYKRLGKESRLRCKTYKALFDKLKSSEQDKLITDATMRGVVYGAEKFHRKIGKLIARPTKLSTHGGDRKSSVFKDQAG